MTICEENTVYRGTASIVATNLQITLPNVSTLTNGDIVHFVITTPIDYSNPLGTVSIVMNGQTILVKTRFNNDLRTSQVRTRRVYTVGFGAQTPTFTMLTCVPESTYNFPTYPEP